MGAGGQHSWEAPPPPPPPESMVNSFPGDVVGDEMVCTNCGLWVLIWFPGNVAGGKMECCG